MKEKAKLILDNQNHKCMVNYEGKWSKLTIGAIDEVSLPVAKAIIQEINELLEANYRYEQVNALVDIVEHFPLISKYSVRSLKVLSKLKSEEAMPQSEEKLSDAKKKTVILNIGGTASGKTKFNVTVAIPNEKDRKAFAALSSMKESTNWTVDYEINHPDKGMARGFEIEIHFKEQGRIRDDISLQILESIQEVLQHIEKQLEAQRNEPIDELEIWNKALAAGFQRLKVNKDKTFDIEHLIKTNELKDPFERLLLKGIREFSTTSTSYEKKLTDEQFLKTLISNYRDVGNDLKLENFFSFVQKNEEYKGLLESLWQLVKGSLTTFKEVYNLQDKEDEFESIVLKEAFDENANKQLIKYVFGSKRERTDEGYSSIEMLVKRATFFFKNEAVNEGEHTILWDGLGINQGQMDSTAQKGTAFSRINKAIHESNPDIIIYHTRLDAKDSLLVNVLNELEVQGYRGRLYIVYGRADIVLHQFCEEDGVEDLTEASEEQIQRFDDYVHKQYNMKEHISLVDDYFGRIFICDKTANLVKKVSPSLRASVDKYLPQPILNNIIKHYKESNNKVLEKMNQKKAQDILNVLDEKQIYSSVYDGYTKKIQESIPINYQDLRWNTLECAIRELSYDNLGFGRIFPTLDMKTVYANFLNISELADYLGDNYNEFLRDFLARFVNAMNLLIITINRFEYTQLFKLRFDTELRKMHLVTLTEERKLLLKSTLLTSLENDKIVGAASIRQVTKNILESMSI